MTLHDLATILLGMFLGLIIGELMDRYYKWKAGLANRDKTKGR